MKRWLLLWTVLALMPVMPARAEGTGVVYALNALSGGMLATEEGEVIVPMGEYEYIYPLDGFDELYAAKLESEDDGEGLCRIIDGKGDALTEAVYDSVDAFDGALFVAQDGLIGALDGQLQLKVPCQYTQLVANEEGGFLGITSDPYDEKADGVYYVDADGNETPTGIRVVNGLGSFGDGLMPVMSSDTSATGYLNARGEWAITAQYDYAGTFDRGRADAAIDSGVGLIDTNGNWLLTPRYSCVGMNSGEGTIIMAQEDNSDVVLIDPDTYRPMKTFTGDEVYFTAYFDNNRAEVCYKDRTLLVDEKGNVVASGDAQTYYDTCADMGQMVIARTGEWGGENVWLLDEKGDKKAGPYQDLAYLCTWNGKTYYTVCAFDVETETDEETGWTGLFAVDGTETYGVIDEDGNETVPPKAYAQLNEIAEGKLLFEDASGLGVMDMSGKTQMYFPFAE